MAVRPELKNEILAATIPVAGTPAEHYLKSRGFEFLHDDFTDKVRWLCHSEAPGWQADRPSPVVPAGYAGAVCYIYHTPGTDNVAWVETDMLTASGDRQPKKKYSFGSPKGAVFGFVRSAFGEWHICEGPMDVMRVHQLRYGSGVVSMGGTSNQPPLGLFRGRWLDFKVFIHADGDEPGQKWARAVRSYLASNNLHSSIIYYPAGQDPNSHLPPYDYDKLKEITNDYTPNSERHSR